MPYYEYMCTECSSALLSDLRADGCDEVCPTCRRLTRWKRVWSLAVIPTMQEHWNRAVNRPISSMGQFKSALARESERASRETGIEHDYQPVDYRDIGPVPE